MPRPGAAQPEAIMTLVWRPPCYFFNVKFNSQGKASTAVCFNGDIGCWLVGLEIGVNMTAIVFIKSLLLYRNTI